MVVFYTFAASEGFGMTDKPVGEFFDDLITDYTATIERCFPRYREMLWAVVDYVPEPRSVRSVLELGCGTGNLSEKLAAAFPAASLQLVDLSGESLAVCRERLGHDGRCGFVQQDFRHLDYPAGSFDLVASSISIHHLPARDKQALFQRIERWLTPRGVFSYADQFRGASDDLYARHVANWRELTVAAGTNESEWEMWMEHQRRHDFHDTLLDQVAWLRAAGFPLVDCVWRYLLWSVVQARKS